jgi:glycine C-acetyltransferase/8-amino-7-oxononanoate synthase
VLGPGGRGSVAAAGLDGEIDVVVGTLGKALGGYGAYVCCDSELATYLVNTSRTLIFSTGPPPPSVAAALAALELLCEQPRLVERLGRNARVLRDALAGEGFPVPRGETQIVPLVAGDPELALAICEGALRRGVFAQAIRPPTVPEGSSRLRLAAMATHTPNELEWAAQQLGAAAREAGGDPGRLRPDAGDLFLYDAELDEPAFQRAA